ncbi:MAG TPA: hypothetical protein VNQ73_22020 [Ilumatobacter sp.]|nr:hypothetical protein [Ilumatobacter sp.]
MRAPARLAAAGLAVLVTAGMFSAGAPVAAETFTDPAAEQLAERYAPVIMTVTQPEPCSTDGEAFVPMSVDVLLDNPQIALRQVGNGDPVVTWGPTAADLHGLGAGFYLDFPGSALSPGCLYEQDYARYTAGLPATVYAHVVTQADRPGQLVVQYWFYWYYNDWNNKHESDWEGIQVVFPASTPEAALGVAPVEVGYAQHEGGERAEWGATKLELVGEHPVVYSSRGSHASYFGASLHLGRSGSEGFGCDTTQGPSTSHTPDVVVLPEAAGGPDDSFAWLGFEGHWGERHDGPYNGPRGPATKSRWTAPLDWQDGLRDASASLPTPGSRSGDIVDGFCEVVEWGSNQLMSLVRSPARMLVTLAVLATLAAWLWRRTVWTATEPLPLVARRRNGQIIRTTFTGFASAPLTFAAIGLAAVPLGVALGLAINLLGYLPVFGTLLDSTGNGDLTQLMIVLASGALASAATFTLVSAAVTTVIDDRSHGRRVSPRRVAERVRSHLGALAGAFGLGALLVLLLGSFVALAPLALFLLVRFQFVAQVAMLEPGLQPRAVLARSAALVRGRWWHTAVTMGLLGGASKLVSALVGLLVLVVVQPPFWLLSIVVVGVDAFLAPLAAITACYLYGDAVAQSESVPDPEPSQPVATSLPH